MIPSQDRRLEVVVLAARSLQGGELFRRKVHLSLVSEKDPNGEAFGAKVSPWTEVASTTKGTGSELGCLRFGNSGLRCSFPLGTSPKAPSLAADVRFADMTQLRVRLLASKVPSQMSVLRTATKLLPTSFADGMKKEFDEATSDIEAEAQIPLANILSGRVGFAADRALGGWVPLRVVTDLWYPKVVNEDVPLSLWMQMFAVPDHEAMVPKLQAQLEEMLERLSGASVKLINQPGTGGSSNSEQTKIESVNSGFAQLATGNQRWGPSRISNENEATKAKASTPAPVADLIDVSLDDAAEHAAASAKPQATATVHTDLLGEEESAKPQLGLISFDSVEAPAAKAAPPGPAPGPAQQTISDDLVSLDFGLGAATTTTHGRNDPERLVASETDHVAATGQQSGFGFVSASPVHDAATLPATGGGPSAFGFIAASSPQPKLDLAALYSNSSVPVPGPGNDVKFAPLLGFEQQDAGSTTPAGSLERLQQDMFSGMNSNVRF